MAVFFFFNDTATTEIYTLSLHDALPILTVAEREARVVGRHHLPECWKRAVVQFHHHALQRRERRGDLEQMQVHAPARPEQRARGDTEGEGIADLSGGAGDGNVHGGWHGGGRG